MVDRTIRILVDSSQAERNTRRVTNEMDRAGNSVNRLSGFIAGFISVAAGIGAVKSIAAIGDEYAKITGLLKNATTSQDEFNAALEISKQVALDTRAGLTETVETFSALKRVTEGTGRSQVELFGILETVNKSIALTSPNAQSAAAALTQFGQALGGDFKAGAQELNSILEQAPGLAQAVASGLGVATKDLKRMGEQGELSAERVLNALQNVAGEIDVKFGNVPKTVSGALTAIRNDMLVTFGDAKVAEPLIASIEEVGKTLNDPAVRDGLVTLTSGLVKLVGWLAQAASGFADFGKEIGFFAASISGQVSEIDGLQKMIERVDKSIGKSRIFARDSSFYFMSDEELAALKAANIERIQEINDGYAGITKADREALERRKNLLSGITVAEPDIKFNAPNFAATSTPKLSFDDDGAAERKKRAEEEAAENRKRAAGHTADEVRNAKDLTRSLGLELQTRSQVASFYRQAQLAEGQSIYDQERALLEAQTLEKQALVDQRATEDTERRNEQQREALDNQYLIQSEKDAIEQAYRDQSKAAIAVYEEEKNAIEEAASQRRIAIAEAEKQAKIKFGFEMASAGIGILQAFGSQSEKRQKKLAKISIAVDTAAGIAKGVSLGWPAGIPAVLWAVINGKKAMDALNKSGGGAISMSGASGVGGGGDFSGGGSSDAAPAFKQKEVIEIRGVSKDSFVSGEQLIEIMQRNDNVIVALQGAQQDAQRRGVI